MLADVAQDHVGGHGRDLVEARLAELAFHVVFLRESESAEGLHAGFRRFPGGFGSQQLGHVGLLAGGQPLVEFLRRVGDHQGGRFNRRIGPGNRKLHSLVAADRAAEYFPLAGVSGGPVDEPAPVADAFPANQRAFGVHPVQDVAKALPLRADQVLRRHPHVIHENLGGGVVHHGADRRNAQARRLAHVDHQDRQAFRSALDLVARGGPGQQDHQVGVFRPRRPDLLPVHDILAVLQPGGGA